MVGTNKELLRVLALKDAVGIGLGAIIGAPRNEQIYGRTVPILGLTGCLAMSVSLPVKVIFTGIGLLITGFILRYFFHQQETGKLIKGRNKFRSVLQI